MRLQEPANIGSQRERNVNFIAWEKVVYRKGNPYTECSPVVWKHEQVEESLLALTYLDIGSSVGNMIFGGLRSREKGRVADANRLSPSEGTILDDDELLRFADENPIPQKWYDEEPIRPPQED